MEADLGLLERDGEGGRLTMWASNEGEVLRRVLGDLAVEVVWGTRGVSPTRKLRGWHVRLGEGRGWRYLGEGFERAVEIAHNIKEAGGRL